MTSRQQYHERKENGLCTKCGNPLGSSISTTRCVDCYAKFQKSSNQRKEIKKQSGLCLGCSINAPAGNSNYCNQCRQADLAVRKTEVSGPLVQFNTTNQACRVCNQKIDTLGILCQKCLANTQFTKTDAIARYGQKCYSCDESSMEALRLVSTSITEPMAHHGPNLYRVVCFNASPPKNYQVSCHSCYWKKNLAHITELRKFFAQTGSTLINNGEDIIDINYENEESDDSQPD